VFFHAPLPGGGRDVILLLGVEPNLRWRTFSDSVVELAQKLNVELVLTLGALLADVPHTRPAPVTGSVTDQELGERLGLSPSRYEGPTGIVGVLHDAFGRAGIASASLWAAVPHYVSLTPSPRAAKALVDRLALLLECEVDTAALDEASEAYAQQVSEAVASDPDTSSYVEELERHADDLAGDDELPSGDALAAELTRYLRERDRDEPGPDDIARG
jgi:predicted ATP-grasp superfamily ATP-dependent carboligase